MQGGETDGFRQWSPSANAGRKCEKRRLFVVIKALEYVDRQASVPLTSGEFQVVAMEIILRSMRLWPSLNQNEKRG